MTDALRVLKFSLQNFWEEFVLLVVLNLLWAVTLVLPIVPLAVLGTTVPIWLLSLFLLIPLSIVSGALIFITNQISRGVAVTWAHFALGLRSYWSKSLIVGVINFVALILILANIQFYAFALEGAWTNIAVIIWIVVGVYWLLVQLFWFPMILELENERVFLALRNALAMVLISPMFTLTLAVVLVLVVALSIALTVPLLLFTASLFGLISNHATRSRIAFAQKQSYQPRITDE
jgi:uncharacterized membrane protein YesL